MIVFNDELPTNYTNRGPHPMTPQKCRSKSSPGIHCTAESCGCSHCRTTQTDPADNQTGYPTGSFPDPRSLRDQVGDLGQTLQLRLLECWQFRWSLRQTLQLRLRCHLGYWQLPLSLRLQLQLPVALCTPQPAKHTNPGPHPTTPESCWSTSSPGIHCIAGFGRCSRCQRGQRDPVGNQTGCPMGSSPDPIVLVGLAGWVRPVLAPLLIIKQMLIRIICNSRPWSDWI